MSTAPLNPQTPSIYNFDDPFYRLLAEGTVTNGLRDLNPQELVHRLSLMPSLKSFSEWISKYEDVLLNLNVHRGVNILAVRDELPRFDSKKIIKPVSVVGADVGGTNLRIAKGIVIPVGNSVEIEVTSDPILKNLSDECDNLTKGRELVEFIDILAKELVASGLTSNDALSISWSFPFKPIIRTGTVPGIGAEITGAEHHRKGTKFYNASLADQINGLRIDEILLSALAKYGVTPKAIVFGNDASNLALADVLDGAFIASTGANGTCVEVIEIEGGGYYLAKCNSEMGAYFLLDQKLLGPAEVTLASQYNEATGEQLSLESIMAGKFLGTYFDANIRSLIGQVPWLSTHEVMDWFLGKGKLGDASLISALATDSIAHVASICPHTAKLIAGNSKPSQLRRELFTEVAKGVMARGGLFAGAMGYFTIAALPFEQRAARVGVDSAVAEGSLIYKASLSRTFHALTHGKADLIFLDRSGPLTPPSVGGFHSAAMMAQ